MAPTAILRFYRLLRGLGIGTQEPAPRKHTFLFGMDGWREGHQARTRGHSQLSEGSGPPTPPKQFCETCWLSCS